MSDSDREETPVLPADAEEALIESTEVDNPVEDADTAQMQTEQNTNNGIDPNDDPAKEPEDEDEDEDMDDLFGDGGDDAAPAKKRRLDDEELDSGDDMDRDDRMAQDDEPESPPQQKEAVMAVMELTRHARLKGSDGEVYLLRNATYNGIEPKVFDPKTFAPPTTNHHSTEPPVAGFSAAQTAATTIRWRRDPNDASKMQSNSRIIRWSDGSLTLQIGSNPLEQYELTAKLATRPQLRPKKPLPAALQRKKAIAKNEEGNIYLTSVDEGAGIGRLTNHVTAFLDVRSNKLAAPDDDAVAKLQMSLNASNAAKHGGAGGIQVVTELEDPNSLYKSYEQAEKQRNKAERLLQSKREREAAKRYGGVAARDRGGRVGGMGLSISALEEEGYGASRKRAPPKKRAKRDDYSDDEDLGRGRTREDEYDEEDDFIAPSDEEEPEGGEDDEEELLDEDAEGEEDDAPVQQSVEKNVEKNVEPTRRRGQRQVVDDDDDDE